MTPADARQVPTGTRIPGSVRMIAFFATFSDMAQRLIAGAMSGTSADGVDVAIVAIDGIGLEMSARLISHRHLPYERKLQTWIPEIRERSQVDLSALAAGAREISHAYATAVQQALAAAGIGSSAMAGIAAHGQTLFHRPPDTIQWIDPALLAAETGCTVISDFRRADCAAGGQGAPLVPFADYILFRDPTLDRAIVNIGGIANITCIPAEASLDRLIAFDTGPGNCISDYLMRTRGPGGAAVDIDGRRASTGQVMQDLLLEMRRYPFFSVRGPKSTDGPEMIRAYQHARNKIGGTPALEDELATACAITAAEIARGLWPFGDRFAGELIAAGGGVRNKQIMGLLESHVGKVRTTDELGIPSQAREAIAFALLGAATLDGIPANVPSVTGASRPVLLGSITPRP